MKNNKSNSRGILSSLLKNLTQKQFREIYNIIQNELKEGIVEKVDEICKPDTAEGENVLYLSHKPVIGKSAETTKLKIVHDASSKPTKNSASLNDCLETRPPLQNVGYFSQTTI